MIDSLAEILMMPLIAAVEAIGEIFLEGVFELIAKTPIAIWSTLQSIWQELRH
jgi:hypothetical protein